MAVQNMDIKSFDELPATLKVEHIAGVMGISKAVAYDLVASEGFPKIMLGKRIIVPKNAFIAWIEKHTTTISN